MERQPLESPQHTDLEKEQHTCSKGGAALDAACWLSLRRSSLKRWKVLLLLDGGTASGIAIVSLSYGGVCLLPLLP